MKDKIKKIVSYMVLLAILACFVYYILTNLEDFSRLTLVNPWLIVLMVALTLIGSAIAGLQTKYLLKPFKIDLKPKEWFGLSITTSFYNMITPFRGGLISRGAYLKSKHNFPYTQFLATLSGTYVIAFLVQSFAGLISMILLYKMYGITNWLITLLFLGFFIPLLIIVLFSPRFPDHDNRWLKKVLEILNGWHKIKNDRNTIGITAIIALGQLLLSTIGGMITYSIIGIHLPFAKALFMVSLGALAIIISITPASLGIAEAVSVFAGLIVGITPAQALTAAIIGRAIGMIVIFILGPIFSYLLMKKNKQ